MMKDHVTVLCWTAILSLFGTKTEAQALPYNPSTILRQRFSTTPKNIAYAFLPLGPNKHLVSFNISANLSPSTLGLINITEELPFTSDDSTAFTPVISANGEISVYTGTCNTSVASSLWRFTPSNTSADGTGTWAQQITNTGSGITAASLPGANFLGKGLTFSAIVQANASQTKIYTFGGMCPVLGANATAQQWQAEASYSGSMLRLAPTTSTAKTSYTLDTVVSRGPPVAEAGFSITPLAPSYSNASGVQTQEQSFVVVGGHTHNAFINMSQVAVWSLPEESWSFVNVDLPTSTNTNTELAIKSTVTSIDSRSGHSAVLSDDGQSIIVYGGWVGDVNTAADPQLAILQLGTGYGGTGDWRWIIPSQQPTGSGMFGHGATMLPGNVMMILGGYNISTSGKTKRAISTGTQALFFNATSMSWVSNYTNPSYISFLAQQAAARASTAAANSRATKLGLGLGIGLGLLAVILAIIFCCFYSRRIRNRNERNREKIVGDLAEGSFYHTHNRQRSQSVSGVFPWSNRGWNGGQYPDSAVAGYTNLQRNADHGLDPIPPPPKPLQRKPLHSRQAKGTYQQAAFDFNNSGNHGRANSLGTAGAIHPIYEADEEDSAVGDESDELGVPLGEPSNRYSDPFKDAPGPSSYALASASGLRRNDAVRTHNSALEPESPAISREREIQEWVTDWAAADLLLHSQTRINSHTGRISPTRRAQVVPGTSVASVSGEEGDSGRTESNLSERSVTTNGLSRSGSSSQRTNSLRGFITGINLNPFASAPSSTVGTSTVMSPVFEETGARSYIPPRSGGSDSTKSFNTARTSFIALQTEGESLLPRPVDARNSGSGSVSPEQYSPIRESGYNPEIEMDREVPGSPSKSKPSAIMLGRKKGQSGWLGSLKRVFVGEDHVSGSSGSSNGERRSVGAGAGRDRSPTRVETTRAESGLPPRRAVSAGATLWRRKQGRSDWDDSEDIFSTDKSAGARSSTFTGGDLSVPGFRGSEGSGLGQGYAGDGPDDDEDWDIEKAVQNRVVQVMFTVPKEKLRVVNHDVESVGSRSAGSSLRSKKGSGRGVGRGLQGGVFSVPPTVEQEEEEREEQRRDDELMGADIEERDLGVVPSPSVTSATTLMEEPKIREEAKILGREKLPILTPVRTAESRLGMDGGGHQTPTSGTGSARSSPVRKKNSRVLEMVDMMEGRSSPERV